LLVVASAVLLPGRAHGFNASRPTQPCIVSSALLVKAFDASKIFTTAAILGYGKMICWSLPWRCCCREERMGFTLHDHHSHALPPMMAKHFSSKKRYSHDVPKTQLQIIPNITHVKSD
jgi:hypothetical protein